MKRVITSLTLLLLLCGAQAQDITQYEYWTDDDYAGRSVASYAGGDISLSISTEQLSAGIHYLNFRAMRSDNVWGHYYRYLYYIPVISQTQSTDAGNMTLEYWLDDNIVDKDSKAVGDGNVSLTIDISTLSPGVHYFNCTPITESGERGSSWRYVFYVPTIADQAPNANIAGGEYWLDDDYAGKVSVTSSDTQQAFTIDVSQLKSGVHYFNYRALDSEGRYGNYVRQLFYMAQQDIVPTYESGWMEYECWIDNDTDHKVTGSGVMKDYMVSLDISGLDYGDHTFNFRAKNIVDQWAEVYTETFNVDWDVNIENIVFADANVKSVCTANWDKNGNGELSTQEAALVEDLGETFKGNREITSFDELSYFTGLTSIGTSAFDGCSSLTSVTIPSNVTTIADYAFNGCYGLSAMTIPSNVESIGNSAFTGCFGLTLVEIPEEVTSIGAGAFNYCNSLTKVKVGHSEPLPIESSTFSNRQNALLYVPTGCKAAFMAADYWKEFMAIIEVKTGDTNGDGNITIADVTALVGHLSGRPPRIFVVEAADANYDGEVNIADAMTIVKNILKGNNEIVPEPKF